MDCPEGQAERLRRCSRELTLEAVGRSFWHVPRPDLTGRSAFLLIFFGRLWYKTA